MTAPESRSAGLDSEQLRRAFGTFGTGVTVMTIGGASPHGMTANSFASVSLDPPLVMMCVGRQAMMHRKLATSSLFAVSVLAAHQEPVARHFADTSRQLGAAEFDSVGWAPGPVSGAPLIIGALAAFECQLWRSYAGGDHRIFLGRVLSMQWREPEEALLFLGGEFRRPAPRQSVVRA